MALTFYFIFVAFVFIKPFEIIAPEMAQYNPMVYISVLALAVSVPHALNSKTRVITSLHLACLLGLIFAIALSWLTKGWLGGAVSAILRAAPSLLILILTLVLITTQQRFNILRSIVTSLAVTTVSVAILDYHYSLLDGSLVLRQSVLVQDSFGLWSADTLDESFISSQKRLRWVGELSDPNDLGQVLIMSLPLLLSSWRPKSLLRNLFFIVVPSCILLYGILLTQSRGAVVGFASIIFIMLYRKFGSIFAVTLSPVAIIIIILAGGTGGREFSTSEASASGRLDAWSAGIEMLRSNPLTGVGYGAFFDNHILTAHNSFVLAFAELGLFGYFFWLGLISIAAMELWKGYRTRVDSSNYYQDLVFIFQAFVSYFVCAWFLSRSYSSSFFLLVGMTICAGRLAYLEISPSSHIDSARWFRLTLLFSILSIIFIYLLLVLNNLISK